MWIPSGVNEAWHPSTAFPLIFLLSHFSVESLDDFGSSVILYPYYFICQMYSAKAYV